MRGPSGHPHICPHRSDIFTMASTSSTNKSNKIHPVPLSLHQALSIPQGEVIPPRLNPALKLSWRLAQAVGSYVARLSLRCLFVSQTRLAIKATKAFTNWHRIVQVVFLHREAYWDDIWMRKNIQHLVQSPLYRLIKQQ